MKTSTSGTECPHISYTWLNAGQAIASNASLAPAALDLEGVKAGNSVCVVSARGTLPKTAGGCVPTIRADVLADHKVTLIISNNNANALVALGAGADCILDIIVMPITP